MGEDLNIPLLDRLRANAGQWLGTTELGLAARRLSDEVEKLRRAGARIDVEDRRGACLLEWPDRLHPDELQWELGTAVIGRRILVYQETASTNDVAWQLSGSSELEGVAVFAESQTRGRGRHGRSWADAPGKGLLFSVLLTPDLPVETSNALTVLGGVAVCEAIQSLTGLAAYLKWPNDVVVGGRKLAGIIVETRGGEAQSPAAFVLGVGINVGQRKDIFDGKPAGVYLPRKAKVTLTVHSPDLHVAVLKAPARRDTAPAYIGPDDTMDATVGKLNWTRDVVTTIGPNVDADRLLVGETWNRAGCWSSFPPHKHDTDNPPDEAWYEEVYFFQVRPRQGFGIQRVYTPKDIPKPIDEVYVIEDGDTIVMPCGYHPVAAAPGYRVWYYWGLAGEARRYAAWSDDPAHAWLRNVEPMI